MKHIPLSHGQVAIVDDSDFEVLSKYTWYVQQSQRGKPRACRVATVNGIRRYILMHRQLMDPPSGYVVDHVNGDTFDNRRLNLRVCTQAENSRNRGLGTNSSSGYKGVSRSRGKYWMANIKIDGKVRFLGRFVDKAEAAREYDRMARLAYGEFARLNFPG